MNPEVHLVLLKAVHTVVWAVFAGCVLTIPISAWMEHFDGVLILVGFVTLEISALALNGWRCPLQRIIEGYTSDRRANFDIYFPEWLASRTKVIFGPLFAIGLSLSAVFWWNSHR